MVDAETSVATDPASIADAIAPVVDAVQQVAPKVAEAVATEAQSEVLHPAERAVRAWLSEHIHNSPISRVVEAWNHLHDRIEILIERLKEI